MDFSQNDDHRELAALSREIFAGHLSQERLREVEAGGDRFDPDLWAELARAGILSAALPASLGGAGLGLLAQCAVLIEIGQAVAPAPYLASVLLGAGALARFGTRRQQEQWAEPAGRGEIVLTAALAEDDGADPRVPAVAAERVAGGWRLSGTKTTVPAGPRAGLLLVPAAVPGGVAVFLVRPDDPRVTVRPQRLVDGDSAGRVELGGLVLGDDRLLGGQEAGPDRGQQAAGWLVSTATVGLCAVALGVAERALELTAQYAGGRVQFGRPIGSFQAVAQRLADAYIDVEAIRLTMWQAAWLLSEDRPCQTEIATAKFWAADGGHRVAHAAVHVHGGVGIDADYPVHRYFTAAKRAEFELGGATAQLLRIGTVLAERDGFVPEERDGAASAERDGAALGEPKGAVLAGSKEA